MQNKKKETPNKLWMYVTIMVILLCVLLYLVFTQGRETNTSTLPSSLIKEGITEKSNNTPSPTISKRVNRQEKGGGIKTPPRVPTEVQDKQSDTKPSNDSSSNTTTLHSTYTPLDCSITFQRSCTIKEDDPLYKALNQSPDSELLVNGVKVKPQKIIYQTSYDTYNDEQMKDGSGKVLSSTQKEYEPTSKTLTIIVGVNTDYYNNLKPTEQRLLYVSQTVRSFMAMFGETPDNFVKVERVVESLSSWNPTP